jgi:hypothetical protein
MLALGKLQDQWPVAGWVLKLFDRLNQEMRSQNRRSIAPNQQGLKRGMVHDSSEPNKRYRTQRIVSDAPEARSLAFQEDYRHFDSLNGMTSYMHQGYQDSITSPGFAQETISTDFGIPGDNTYFTLFPGEGGEPGYPLLDEVFAWAI